MLGTRGALAALEHYARENTFGWWDVIVQRRRPGRSFEWVLVRDAEDHRSADPEVVRRAEAKLAFANDGMAKSDG